MNTNTNPAYEIALYTPRAVIAGWLAGARAAPDWPEIDLYEEALRLQLDMRRANRELHHRDPCHRGVQPS